MADRYWVGGTASWDGTAGTKWATTSGGAGGAAVPTSADDVYFDANSGASTVTIASGNTGAKSITCTSVSGDFTGTITGSAAITVAGSITLVAGMTYTHTGTVTISGTGTLITAGKTFSGLLVSAAGITVTLGDALNIGLRTLTLTQGTFVTANYNVTADTITLDGTSARTFTAGSSTILVTGASFRCVSNTNLTFNADTSQINISGTSTSLNIVSTGLTFYNVSFISTSAGTRSISGANTFNNLSVTAPSAAGVSQLTFAGNQTINGTLSTSSTAGNRRVWFRSDTYGVRRTLTVNAASLTDADFRDIIVLGAAAPLTGTRIGNRGACSGITFSTPKTVYWNLAGAQNWSADGWATTSTGTPSTDNFPLPQDTATFTNAGSVTGTITLDTAIGYAGNVDMSGRTSAMTLSVSANTIYGNWTNGSGTTLSGTGTLTFSGGGTQTITSAGKSFGGDITVDNYGGTVQLADALNIGTRTLTVTNGTFDTKNYNVTASNLSTNNTNVRSIKLGSSTVTLSSTGTAVQLSATNLSFDAGTSQITLTGPSNINGSGNTFYNVSFTSTTAGSRTINNANTFNNITITASATAGLVNLIFDSNQTINGTLTVAGASPVRRIFVQSDTLGTTRTLTVNTLSATDCDFRDITIAGAAAGSSPTRAGNCGGNSGITFPSPKTVYWNLAGAQNWSATAWAPSSGGTPDINNFPLAQDTAVFDEAAGSVTGTITVDQSWNIGTFDASARTSAMTFTIGTTSPLIYGDWKFGTGVTQTSTTGTITFSKRGTQTITCNGVSFGCQVNIDNVNGTTQISGTFKTITGRVLALASGTFDAGTDNVEISNFSTNYTTSRTLKMGSGTWTLSTTGTVWFVNATNLNFYKGTANIVLSDTSTTARTFEGGGLSYNKLTIGGTTGTSTLTISSNNQFTELASTKTVAHTIALGSTTQTFGKWSVTGTSGNVVTLTGTGTSHVLAGPATSGIDYLAMGSIGFAATSPGEFYAGANSTGTAGAPVYRTATPAATTRYWVGGTGNWSDTNRWSTGSGGSGGASVPTSLDDVVFDAASNATAYTATVDVISRCNKLTIAGPTTGNVTLAGSVRLILHDDVTLPATGLTRAFNGNIALSGTGSGKVLTTNGVTLGSDIIVNGVDCVWTLGSALTQPSTNAPLTITNGTFDTGGYNLTTSVLRTAAGTGRTINLNNSTVSLGWGSSPVFDLSATNTTFNAGTSTINIDANSNSGTLEFIGNGNTFYNVNFQNTGSLTSSSLTAYTLTGANTFNNLTYTSYATTGYSGLTLDGNQTINGTFTVTGRTPTQRVIVRSNTLDVPRTLTCAAFSGTDSDFSDITISGVAAPASGTRLGDCKGNTGITFDAAKTVYFRSAASANWLANVWSLTNNGSLDVNAFPLPQDTAVFPVSPTAYPTSGNTVTINALCSIGTIDMSNRTTSTMTLACSATHTVYGNWINGTGTTITGTNQTTFSGRGSQTITSAGKAFSQAFVIATPGGSVTLQDALTNNRGTNSSIDVSAGTFSTANYNVTLSGGITSGNSLSSYTKSIAFGSGTWTIAGTLSSFNLSNTTNLTATGTGTITMTAATEKRVSTNGFDLSGITLNQGGAGDLNIQSNCIFKDITNTYSATGAALINFGANTVKVSQFTATGTSGKVLTITGTTSNLIKTTSGATSGLDYLNIQGRAYGSAGEITGVWYGGANSTNSGSLGWEFSAAPAPASGGGMFFMFN